MAAATYRYRFWLGEMIRAAKGAASAPERRRRRRRARPGRGLSGPAARAGPRPGRGRLRLRGGRQAIVGGTVRTMQDERGGEGGMLERHARWVIKRRWWVVAAWAVLLIIGFMLASRVGDVTSNQVSLPGKESQRGLDMIEEHF